MMNKIENSPIVISGPSGAGKSELIDYVEKKYPTFLEATGITTREKRKVEVGRMYFVSKEEFQRLILSNGLIEYCMFNNNFYGVPKSEFDKLKEYHLMFNVGYTSAREIKNIYEDTKMIYLLPPTSEELIRRLGDRGKERYIIGIQETVDYAFKYDYLLISITNNLQQTADDLMDIVNQKNTAQQKKLILAKNRDFVNNFYKKGD